MVFLVALPVVMFLLVLYALWDEETQRINEIHRQETITARQIKLNREALEYLRNSYLKTARQ